ncbi:hypothetical protein LEMLEM_LOCUS18442 [Lemmus lemmus]
MRGKEGFQSYHHSHHWLTPSHPSVSS